MTDVPAGTDTHTDTVLRVGVIGAQGRMGSEVCKAVDAAPDMDLVGAVDGREWLFSLADAGSDVVVDFTHPDAVMEHIRFAVDQGIHCVVGTSGVDGDRLDTIRGWLEHKPEVGVMVVPNFAIGAVLAASFARQAARFFGSAEIIELHHAGKIDAPSGTAVNAARALADGRAAARLGPVPDATTVAAEGARGAVLDGIHVHSVRLPGLVAHLEVLLGNEGETLTIRHDSTSPTSFMPGVLAAIRSVGSRPGLTVGLEHLLD
jgi:4-hydroxy-tetrahydrodipicolinate reductase